MCRPPAMLADCPAASDGGPVVSHTQHPVGDRVHPSRYVCFLTGAPWHRRPAISRAHPTCDVDQLSSGVWWWGRRWFPGPLSGSRWQLCFPCRARPVPPTSRFGRATASYVNRPWVIGSRHRPGTALGVGRRSPPPPFAPPLAIQLRSHRKKYILGRNQHSRSRPENCDSRHGNVISRELTSLKDTLKLRHILKRQQKLTSSSGNICITFVIKYSL